MDYSKVIICGRISNDITFTAGNPEKNVDDRAYSSLAVNRPGKGGKADFHRFIAWGAAARVLRDYAYKGKEVILEGSLQTYEKTVGDTKVTTTEVVVTQVVLGADTAAKREEKKATPAQAEDHAAKLAALLSGGGVSLDALTTLLAGRVIANRASQTEEAPVHSEEDCPFNYT